MSKYQDIESQDFNTGAKIENNGTYAIMNPRQGLIRKVYGILCCQLLLTVLICLLPMYSASFFAFMLSNAGMALLICAFVMTIVVAIMLFCCFGFARQVPINYVLLTIFTMCEAYMVSYCCAATSPRTVFMAAILTLGITISLTIYAMTTKTDFTYMGGMLFVFAMVFFLAGIFMLFTDNPILHVVYAAIGVCLYGLYLIYDTQKIVGGEGKRSQLDLDDYVIGAIQIYLDIVLIFVFVLDILNRLF